MAVSIEGMGAFYFPARIKIVTKIQPFYCIVRIWGVADGIFLAYPGSASDRSPSFGDFRGLATPETIDRYTSIYAR